MTSKEGIKKSKTKKGITTAASTKTRRVAKEPKSKFKIFLIAVLIIVFPLIVGLISSALTGDAMMSFGQLKQPPLAPPAWLFPVAWTILYILMGVASYLIFRLRPKTSTEKKLRLAELIVYLVQLIFNFFWTLLFFKFELRFFAFGWLVAMWLMILALIIMAFKNCRAAAWCLIPYILWCTFASYLNIMVAVLN